MPARNTLFTTIRTEGALLPADLLQRITEGTTLDGLTPESYHRPGEKLNEVINRSWNALQGIWASFRTAQARLPEGDSATTLTRERWLLPLFRELDYGRLPTAPAAEIDGRSYPISHAWEQVPVHLVSYKLDLDKRTPGATGAAAASPHSLLQVFLNRSEGHLWGFVSNGYKLRLLRDNASLTRQAYVEFDLEAMLEGEVYSDFVLLWLLCHQSRLEGERPADCWLEKWMKVAEEQGTRALDQLREGVEAAITALGLGFLEYPANHALRDKLTSGDLSAQDYYRQLLRMVYRLLFLFVAEDRDLLLNPQADSVARERYILYYSTQRLRRMAETFKGTRHPDLFEGLRLVMRLLSGNENGAGKSLGLVPLGSYLFSDGAVTDLIACQIANTHLLDAIRALSLTYDRQAQVYRPVDYKNLGSDELGSIFESLLELHPEINVPARRFALSTAAGNERKTTGSYYTPESLVHALLDSALDPVIESALRGDSGSPLPEGEGLGVRVGDEGYTTPESRLLNLKVCDPACGSGHFLIAAAHRLAKALAYVRTGEEEPPPAAIQEAKRDVISHCIYGVDINPMAVELCKVNLWLEALEPGKPLNFLDHRIQVGNSLLGTTPALMAGGIPDDAFNPIEGDDPKTAAALKKLNKQERKQREAEVFQRGLWDDAPAADYTRLTEAMHALDDSPDDTLDEVRRKEAQYTALANDPEYVKARLLADAWCAAFVWEKGSPLPTVPSSADGAGRGAGGEGLPPMTDLLYRRLERDPLAENLGAVREYIVELKERYQFFHWHVAFPDVFNVPDDITHAENEQTGWHGGFDCVLGNPPWERIQLEEKQFFITSRPDIASARSQDRKKLIASLEHDDPSLFKNWMAASRYVSGQSHYVKVSDMFPCAGYGNINVFAVFGELNAMIINSSGFVGMIVPSALVTETGNQKLFGQWLENKQIVRVVDFENKAGLFPAVHSSYRFSLLVLASKGRGPDKTIYSFMLHEVYEMTVSDRILSLGLDDITLVSPNSLTCPPLTFQHDLNLLIRIHKLLPIINDEVTGLSEWEIESKQMLNSSHDSENFIETNEIILHALRRDGTSQYEGEAIVRLYDGKMIDQFDHRAASVEYNPSAIIRITSAKETSHFEHINPEYIAMSQYWVFMNKARLVQPEYYRKRHWLLGFRAVTASTNWRTLIAAIVPQCALIHTTPALFSVKTPNEYCAFISALNSFVLDYVSRLKIGGVYLSATMLRQLPVLPPHTYTQPLLDFIVPRVLELTYTAWDLQPFAQDVGYHGPPFIWDEERRFLMRCELDALYFHLYHISRDDVDYIMETFPIVKRKDIARTADENGEGGEYLTKCIILEMYDQMAALPKMSVPAPKSPPRPEGDAPAEGGEGYAVPDVSQWATWLNPPPADPSVAHGG